MPSTTNHPSATTDVIEAMKWEVDCLAVTTAASELKFGIKYEPSSTETQTQTDRSKAYQSKVISRVNRARAEAFGGSVYSQIESPP
jgi:hypothetical protein